MYPPSPGKSKQIYRFYDTPDSEDFLPKLWYTTKLFGVSGAIGNSIRVYHFQDYPARGQRYFAIARGTFPFLIAAAAYTVVTTVSAKIRHANDEYNSVYGGTAAGVVLGTWFKSYRLGLFGVVCLAVGGAIAKHGVMIGHLKVPLHYSEQDILQLKSSWALRTQDFSLVTPIKGNYIAIPGKRPEPKEPECCPCPE